MSDHASFIATLNKTAELCQPQEKNKNTDLTEKLTLIISKMI